MRSLILSLFLISCVLCKQDKLKISIYYETLCPDSIRFFRYQFDTTYEKLLPYVNFDFLPYGHATHRWENDKWNIQCQHGQKECVGNRFHACALAQNNGYETDVRFVTCSMSYTNPTSFLHLRDCCSRLNIDFDIIDNCFSNGTGHELLVQYGERTAALTPQLSYVPTIVFNDVYDQNIQYNAESNLLKTVCDYLKNDLPVC